MTHAPKVRSGKRRLEDELATITKYLPGAKIVNRHIVLPTALVSTSRKPKLRAMYPKIKAAATKPRDVVKEQKTTYGALDKNYREYRTNNLVRSCVNVRALMATNKGFKTEVFHKDPKVDEEVHEQLQKDHTDLIQFINDANKQVNMDDILRISFVNDQIHGRSGFEKDLETMKGQIRRLIPLDGSILEPEYDEKADDPWAISSFKYGMEKEAFQPDDILYFPYNSLDGKRLGLSDVEAVLVQSQTKRMIVEEILPEALTVAWAGVVAIQANTEDMSADDEDTFLQALIDEWRPTKIIAFNHRVTNIQVVKMEPNLTGIMEVGKLIDEDIIGYFRVPPFVLGRHREVNRATAYTQLDNWINGDITDLQRKKRRQVDAQWNDYLTIQFLNLKDKKTFEELDYRACLVWNSIKIVDFVETGATLASLKGSDAITMQEVYRILGLNPADIEKDLLEEAQMKQKLPQPAIPKQEGLGDYEPIDSIKQLQKKLQKKGSQDA